MQTQQQVGALTLTLTRTLTLTLTLTLTPNPNPRPNPKQVVLHAVPSGSPRGSARGSPAGVGRGGRTPRVPAERAFHDALRNRNCR